MQKGLTIGALALALALAVIFGLSRVEKDRGGDMVEPAAVAQAVSASTTRPALDGDLPGLSGETRRRERDEPEPTELVAAPETGVALGWGWNKFHVEAIPTICVEFVPQKMDNAQTAMLDFQEVNDTFELMAALDMSAEGSVKTMGVEVSGEAKFASKTKVNGSDLTYVIEAEVLNSPTLAAPAPPEDAGPTEYGAVRLTRDAERLARRDVELFKDVCGTGFISSTMGGAKLSVVVSIQTRSKSQRTSVSASVEGKGWGGKAKAAMSGSSGSDSSSLNRKVTFFQSGGKPAKIPTAVDDIIAHVEGLATAADAAEKIFRIGVTPYEVLENWPREDDISGQEREFEQLAAFWGAYRALYDDLETALATPGAYVAPVRVCNPDCRVEFHGIETGDVETRVRGLQDEVLATLDRLEIAARLCSQAEDACDTDINVYRSPYAVRVRMPVLTCLLRDTMSSAEVTAHQTARLEAWNAAFPDDPLAAGGVEARLTFEATLRSKIATENTGGTVTYTDDETAFRQAGRSYYSEFQIDPTCDPATIDAGGPATAAETYGDVMVAELAKGRCRLGSLTPGCLSNAAIAAWRDRIGMMSVIEGSVDGAAALAAGLGPKTELTPPNEGEAPAKSCVTRSEDAPVSDPETRLLTSVWFPPACQAQVTTLRGEGQGG